MAKKDQRLRYSWPLGDVGLGVTAPKVENPCITFDSPKTSVIPWYMQGIVHTHTHTPKSKEARSSPSHKMTQNNAQLALCIHRFPTGSKMLFLILSCLNLRM